jgi:hypothetical protein
MNEVIIVAHPGDDLRQIICTAIDVVKLETVSYALFTFNECNVFVKKNSTEETIMCDYQFKLRQK